ncbi:MAG: hypothetical protein RXO71_02330 [Nitrososphaeria archaeon]|jgi:DNA replication factor GINS|nr:hypothetical protein [Nitrososphaerota archaeon]
MQDIISLLNQAVTNELKNEEKLGQLPAAFYGIISLRLKQLKVMELTASTEEAKLAAKELRKNITELVNALMQIRVRKMFNTLLKGGTIEVDEYEKPVVPLLVKFVSQFNELRFYIVEGKTKELEHFYKDAPTVYYLVQFLSPTDKFMGSDLIEYGPFEAGDIATLPQENAKILIEKNIVKKVGEI